MDALVDVKIPDIFLIFLLVFALRLVQQMWNQ